MKLEWSPKDPDSPQKLFESHDLGRPRRAVSLKQILRRGRRTMPVLPTYTYIQDRNQARYRSNSMPLQADSRSIEAPRLASTADAIVTPPSTNSIGKHSSV